jgi:hypothetical protein
MNTIDTITTSIQTIAGITKEQASKVVSLYMSKKIGVLKIDVHNGGIEIKHGAFMDKQVILRALKSI